MIIIKLNANFPGLLSALQLFSHPLTRHLLIIGLPCDTYSRVSPGKLFLSPFQAAYIEISRLGNSRQTSPYQGAHLYTWVKRSKHGTNFLLRKIRFEPGTPRSRVLSLTTRPPSPLSVFSYRHFFYAPKKNVFVDSY